MLLSGIHMRTDGTENYIIKKYPGELVLKGGANGFILQAFCHITNTGLLSKPMMESPNTGISYFLNFRRKWT